MIGSLDQELYPGVWMCALDGSPAMLEIHKYQLRKIKKKRTLFIARFSGPTLTDSGLSLPMQSLEEAASLAGRQKLEEIFEVQEIRKYDLNSIPAKPAFLEKRGIQAWLPEGKEGDVPKAPFDLDRKKKVDGEKK